MPFPTFVLDNNLNIIEQADITQHHFPGKDNFLQLVDIGSQQKLKNAIKTGKPKLELNLLSKTNKLTLYDVFFSLEKTGHPVLYCIEKQSSTQAMNTAMQTMEKQVENDRLYIQETKDELLTTLWKMENLTLEQKENIGTSRLAATIASELQGPLLSIKGFIELLKPHLEASDKELFASVALKEIEKTHQLINQYILTTQTATKQRELVNIQHLLNDCIQSFTDEAEGCKLQFVKTEILPAIKMDPEQMRQVFLNVLNNARKAIQHSKNKDNGLIKIKAYRLENNIHVTIQDNGTGIKEVLRDNLFKPDYTNNRKEMSLGLSVSRQVMSQHGGSIELMQTDENGSTFLLTLPIN